MLIKQNIYIYINIMNVRVRSDKINYIIPCERLLDDLVMLFYNIIYMEKDVRIF